MPAPSAAILVHTSATTFNWVCSAGGNVVAERPTLKSCDKVHTQVPAWDISAVALSGRAAGLELLVLSLLLTKSGKTNSSQYNVNATFCCDFLHLLATQMFFHTCFVLPCSGSWPGKMGVCVIL